MRAFVFVLSSITLGACGVQNLLPPTAATPPVTTSVATTTTSIPAPTFTVSGNVLDGSSIYAGGGVTAGTVVAVDAAHAGKSQGFSGAFYTMRGVTPGTLTLSVSGPGYGAVEKTIDVQSDTRLDFALPRVSKTPVPQLAATWGTRVETSSQFSPAEFTLVQSGSSISGTWFSPFYGWRGTLSGTIDSERSFRGRISIDSPCTISGDVRFGVLDYPENVLQLGATLASCGRGDIYTFVLDRRCRMVNNAILSCN